MGTIFSDEDLAVAAHDVRDFGAKGDGMTKDTAAIQRAIDKCGESGGGRVVLANGTFLSGAIQLRTGVELHIDGTARFLASPDIADFPEWKDVRHVDSASLPRGRNDKTNALLKEFADRDGKIVWIDFNDSLVDEQGWVPESIMADEIHPTDVGYDIWMKNLSPHIP